MRDPGRIVEARRRAAGVDAAEGRCRPPATGRSDDAARIAAAAAAAAGRPGLHRAERSCWVPFGILACALAIWSSADPGQAGLAPAATVLRCPSPSRSLEAFQDVRVAELATRAAWRERTPERHRKSTTSSLSAACCSWVAKSGFGAPPGYRLHCRAGPRHGGAADPVALRIRADVDQFDARIGLQQGEGFLRRDGAGAGRGAFPGGGQDLVACAHGFSFLLNSATRFKLVHTAALAPSWCVWMSSHEPASICAPAPGR
jgi:hypothetical protein